MATVESRSLTIERSNVTQYMTADNVTLDTSYMGNDCAFRSSAKTGYAILNDAAKAVLFPNATAKPLKADSTMQIGASTTSSNNYVELQFGGTSVHHQLCKNANETKEGLTDSAITGATQNTEIRYKVNINSSFVAAIVTHVILTLYFNKYTCSANIVGDGITAASVDKTEAYDGDTVTFTATIKAGATWQGWYSDAACTQLVSTSQTYTTAAADLTLYAKAVLGIYTKCAGAYKAVQKVYKKISGAWAEQTDFAAIKSEIQTSHYDPALTLYSLPVGQSVFINIGGERIEFLITHQGKPASQYYNDTCKGTWLLAKDIYSLRQMSIGGSIGYSSGIAIQEYANNEFLELIPEQIRNRIKIANFPYDDPDGSRGMLNCRVTIPREEELGVNKTSSNNEYVLDYFKDCAETGADAKRVAKYNGAEREYWVREIICSAGLTEYYGVCVVEDGSTAATGMTSELGFRPQLVFQSYTLVNNEFDIIG